VDEAVGPAVRAEFTIFPFVHAPGLPAYVQVAVDAARATGVRVDVGPLSNVIEGTAGAVLDAVHAAQAAAFAAGATRFSLNVELAR
jgi:uncharacterized protein YqgV (UPF0045/DUF77 family)